MNTDVVEDVASIGLNADMLQVKVIAKQVQAEGVASYELAAVDGALLPAFEAGAHIDVHLAGGIVRQYSLYNAPGERHRYCIGVLRDPASRGGSVALVDGIEQGAILTISAPRNHFQLDGTARRSLLFAGGIGITPILCMAQQLNVHGGEFEFHYCGRSADRMAFTDFIRQSAFAARTHLHTDDGPEAQRLDAARAIGAPDAGTHLYVCGPTGFMDHVLATARGQGWPEEQLHREYFAGAVIDHSADGAFDVEIKSTGALVHVKADQSVSQALEEAGIAVAVSCEQGVCGTCLTRVLDGKPDHRDMYLTDAERKRNDCFMPCCSRSQSARLVLDL